MLQLESECLELRKLNEAAGFDREMVEKELEKAKVCPS